jgi:hypothetical protein
MAKTSVAALGLVLKRSYKSSGAGQKNPAGITIRWRLLASQASQVSPIVCILQAEICGITGTISPESQAETGKNRRF